MLRRTALPTAIFVLALSGCGEPGGSSTPQVGSAVGQDTTAALEALIRRVENGLILVSEEGEILGGQTGTIAERMEHYGVPGVSIAVIDDFQIAWARGYGVLEAGGAEVVGPHALFHAGSFVEV